MTDLPPDPTSELFENLAKLMDMIRAATEPVIGICKNMRDGGVPEEAISEFATVALRNLTASMFGATP